MTKSLSFLLGLCLTTAAWRSAAAAQEAGAPSQWIPADAVIAVEVFQPKALLAPLCDEKGISMIASLPAYRKQEAKPEFKKFLALVRYLETRLGADWPTALSRMTGGGIAFGVCPEQRVMFVADAEDERMLAQLHETLYKAASNGRKGSPSGGASSQQIEGVTAWSLGPKETHAIAGKRLVASSSMDGLRASLALREKNGAASLASTPAYQAARRAVGPDAIGMVFINADVLKHAPAFAKALKPDNANPLAALLFAGITETAGAAKWLALGLHAREGGLALQLVSNGAPPGTKGSASFALPDKPDEGALPNLAVPRQIAAFSLYRDLHRFYAAKDQLFPERTSGLIFFENMMGIFFSGRDLTDDVMAQTTPHIRFVVANQKYDSAADAPAVRIPAFAAILEMRNPDQFRELVEEGWQKAVGLASFTRGQRAEPGLIIDRPVHWTTKFTVARFSTAAVKDRSKLDMRFNFRPSLAMPGHHLILSSTDDLACDLMDALGREDKQKAAPQPQTHSLVELDGDKLAAAFQANREALVRQNMLKSGGTGESDATGIDWLIGAAAFVDHLRLSIGMEAGMSRARLELNLKWPSQPGQKMAEAR